MPHALMCSIAVGRLRWQTQQTAITHRNPCRSLDPAILHCCSLLTVQEKKPFPTCSLLQPNIHASLTTIPESTAGCVQPRTKQHSTNEHRQKAGMQLHLTLLPQQSPKADMFMQCWPKLRPTTAASLHGPYTLPHAALHHKICLQSQNKPHATTHPSHTSSWTAKAEPS